MIPITLQISLPEDLRLTGAELAKITGRMQPRLQLEWLKANAWEYTLDAEKGILVGKLYAHLRLAGMHPAHLAPAAPDAGGFNMANTR